MKKYCISLPDGNITTSNLLQSMDCILLPHKIVPPKNGVKVILTVRDSSAQQKRSLINFIRQEQSRLGNPGYWIVEKMKKSGFLGPKLRQLDEIGGRMMSKFFVPGCDYKRTFWTWQAVTAYMEPVQ